MTKVMLKMSDHGEFCKRLNANIEKEDLDSQDVSTFVTSSEKNASFASTTLKIFSPLYCEITKDLKKDKDYGRILILPDFESSTVHHLLDLVSKGSTGQISGNVDKITKDILALADALEINMSADTLTSDAKKTEKIKLRDIGELKNVNNNIEPRDYENLTSEAEEEVPDVLVCRDCGLGHSLGEASSHKDGICKKVAQSKHATKSREEGITRVLQCALCGGMSFNTAHDRKKHMYYVHGYCYDCKNCDAIFSTARSRNNHINLVHGPRPYKCEFSDCGVFFSSKFDLFTHQHLHYRQTKEPRVQSMQFSSVLSHHLQEFHKEN